MKVVVILTRVEAFHGPGALPALVGSLLELLVEYEDDEHGCEGYSEFHGSCNREHYNDD